MNSYLTKIKEELSQLTSILQENKYFELKNRIVIYELKFKKFIEENESKEDKKLENKQIKDNDYDQYLDILQSNNVELKLNKSILNDKPQKHIYFNTNKTYYPTNKQNESGLEPNEDISPINSDYKVPIKIIKRSSNQENTPIISNRYNKTKPNFDYINDQECNSCNSKSRSGSQMNNYDVNQHPHHHHHSNNYYISTPDIENTNEVRHRRFNNSIKEINGHFSNSYSHNDDYCYDCEISSMNRKYGKKVQTSDKSTATINEMSTQTENISITLNDNEVLVSNYQSPLLTINSNCDDITPNCRQIPNAYYDSVEFRNRDQDLRYMDRIYPKPGYKNKFSKHPIASNRESDGKQFLLEAYLRNDNLVNGSTSSSGKGFSTLSSKKKTFGQRKIDVATTRESGIGTTNDDEIDSLPSVHNDDDCLSEYDENMLDLNNNKNENNNHDELDASKSNNEDAESFSDNPNSFEKLNASNKPSDLKDDSSKRNDISNLFSSPLQNNSKKEKLKKKCKPKMNNSKSVNNKANVNISTSKPNINELDIVKPGEDIQIKKPVNKLTASPKFNMGSPSTTASAASSLFEANNNDSSSSLFKKICTFLLFIFPLLFLLIVYYIYVYVLNPSCCDFKRNYLFLNVS